MRTDNPRKVEFLLRSVRNKNALLISDKICILTPMQTSNVESSIDFSLLWYYDIISEMGVSSCNTDNCRIKLSSCHN